MKTILTTEFGSLIYGTNTPSSDKDYKSIFVPSGDDLVLQRGPKHIEENTKKDQTKRNEAGDVDHEKFSVQAYCKLLAEGQTPALDVLFSPEKHHSVRTWEFESIKECKNIFLSNTTTAFLGYTKTQAAKYGLKGFRVAALKQTKEFLEGIENEYLKLHDTDVINFALNAKSDTIKIVTIKNKNNIEEPYLEVNNKKYSFTCLVKYVKEKINFQLNNYGHRALMAEKNEGVDWKALYHAVRVSHQCEELLMTGNITFPRPEKELLLKIRSGSMPYKEVAEIIEARLELVDGWQKNSILPAKPDYEQIDNLVYAIHKEQILRDFNA